jgi:tetratricopeptide (TPR) repeat protein
MHLGPYVLISRLGAGSSAVVWRAREPDTGHVVAIKVLTGDIRADPERLSSFRVEARAAARLSHRNVVRLLDQGEVKAGHRLGQEVADGAPYLVMEYMPRGSLAPLRGRLGGQELIEVCQDVLAALAHAHAHALIHRDVKPANLMRDAHGRVCLADFGLAWRPTSLLAGGPLAGTPNYMPPEQILENEVLGPYTDLYALGCTLWALVTGQAPFAGRGVREVLRAHLREAPGDFRPLVEVPAGFEAWLRILMAKAPKDRFQRAADAMASLGDVCAGRRPRASTVPVFVGTGWREQEADSLPAGVGLGVLRIRQVPLVGREETQRTLWGELGRVHREGQPRLVLLEGGEGLGRERLGEWVAQRAEELGVGMSLRLRHAPELARNHGFSGAIARLLGLLPLARDEREPRLDKALLDLDLEKEADGVRRLLGSAWVGREVSTATPEERAVVLLRVLQSLCAVRPVLLLVDEVQWAGASLELLRRVLTLSKSLPVLIIGTLRPDLMPSRPTEASLLEQLGEQLSTLRVQVLPLSGAAMTEFLDQLIGLEPPLVRQVVARCDGHPVFAFAIVGDWAAASALEPGPNGLRLRRGTRVEIPDSVHVVFSRRLRDLLKGPSGLGLMAGAVLGQQVSQRELDKVCRSLHVVMSPDWMDVLVERDLVLPDPDAGGRSWSWSHNLVRESLLRSAREAGHWAVLHRACAEMLEPHGGVSARERRANHLRECGDLDRAIAQWVNLSKHYLRFGDRIAAERLIHRLEGLRAGRRDSEVWVRHDLHRAWLAWEMGHANASPLVRSAERRTRAMDNPALLAELLLADLPRRMEVAPDSVPAVLEETLSLTRELGRPDLKLRHASRVAVWLGRQGAHQAAVMQARKRLAKTPAKLSPEIEEERLHLQRILAWSLTHLGLIRQAREVLMDQLTRYRELGHRMMVAQCLNALGEASRAEGDVNGARRWYLEALAAGQQAGLERLIAYPELNLGLLETQQAQYALAKRHLERAGQLFRRLNSPGPLLTVALCEGLAAAKSKDLNTLVRRLHLAKQTLPRLSESDPDVGWAVASLVRECWRAGWPAQTDEAMELAQVVLSDLGEMDALKELRFLIQNG